MRSLASELASLHTNVKALTHKEDSLLLDVCFPLYDVAADSLAL